MKWKKAINHLIRFEKAQSLGYAEPNNPLDLNGSDAFAKVKYYQSSLTQNFKNKCIMEGIENIDLKDINIAGQLGCIKLLNK